MKVSLPIGVASLGRDFDVAFASAFAVTVSGRPVSARGVSMEPASMLQACPVMVVAHSGPREVDSRMNLESLLMQLSVAVPCS